MKEQEVIKRLNFHKEYARLSSNRVVISETDLETVLNILKEKDKEINKYKKKNRELSNQLLMFYKEQDNNAARIDKENAEIEKYKYLYQKALDNTIEADRENIQLKKQIDLMAERLRFDEELKFEVCKDCEPLKEELCGEPTKTQYQPTELKCVKQYFERKVRDERN